MSLVPDVHITVKYVTVLTPLMLMEKIARLSTHHVEQAQGQNVDRLLHKLLIWCETM